MFSFLKRKPKTNNETSLGLALMLTHCPEDPVINVKFLESVNLDYSIESLKYVDDYLESLRNDKPQNDELIKITMRCGSYIGEVIRKHATESYDWLEHKQASKINEQIKSWGFGLATASVLWGKPDKFIFPFAKVLKRIENGTEDSVYSFAQIVCSGKIYN